LTHRQAKTQKGRPLIMRLSILINSPDKGDTHQHRAKAL
jgi:hypothetical protein